MIMMARQMTNEDMSRRLGDAMKMVKARLQKGAQQPIYHRVVRALLEETRCANLVAVKKERPFLPGSRNEEGAAHTKRLWTAEGGHSAVTLRGEKWCTPPTCAQLQSFFE